MKEWKKFRISNQSIQNNNLNTKLTSPGVWAIQSHTATKQSKHKNYRRTVPVSSAKCGPLTLPIKRALPEQSPGWQYPMLVLHMNNEIIIPLDPLLANILASWKWTVKPLGKMYHFIVSVERLFCFERGWPGTTRCITRVRATGASVWTASRG